MIRIALLAVAVLATLAAASSALAQASAPARPLGSPVTVETPAVRIAERKAAPCADKTCAGKPLKRGYVAAARLAGKSLSRTYRSAVRRRKRSKTQTTGVSCGTMQRPFKGRRRVPIYVTN